MKITILSGGSGNDALVRGLKSFSSDVDVTVVTNAYDSGKSTGICRKVTDTLGVSDIRKNHSRMYEATTKNPDKRLLEFYNNRFDLTNGRELEEVKEKLINWGLLDLICYAESFFGRDSAKNYEYKDFSIANIIYSEMYSKLGYELTNSYFCKLLGLKDFVLLNSFDNVYLKAVTIRGDIIEDEGDLVKFANPSDKIESIYYYSDKEYTPTLNQKAIDAVLDCDLLVISTGTFWSSIYPTLHYGDFYKFVNESKAKKIWAMDNEEDKDAYGVTSNDFIDKFIKLGLDLSEFTILENEDAKDTLRLPNKSVNIVYKSMGNNNGKHDGTRYAKALLSIYYNINKLEEYDKILFDFDDTIWSRDLAFEHTSISNLKTINDKLGDRAMIISGNVFKDSIKPKLFRTFGTDLSCLNVNIWADANSILYTKGSKSDVLVNLLIDDDKKNKVIDALLHKFGIVCTVNDQKYTSNIKIKPLNKLERSLLVELLNNCLLKRLDCDDLIAYATGKTTIDIVKKNNSKAEVFNHYEDFSKMNILYIGDEVDEGNDMEISRLCTNSIHTSSVSETSTLLKLLIEG